MYLASEGSELSQFRPSPFVVTLFFASEVNFHELLLNPFMCYSRQGLRVHYPSQTAAPSRGFPDFLLRAPAASVAEPESGSTTEVSESDEDDEVHEEGNEERTPAAVPIPSGGHHLSGPIQHTQPQDAGSTSESEKPLTDVSPKQHVLTFTFSHWQMLYSDLKSDFPLR